jgi:hypothetical protein
LGFFLFISIYFSILFRLHCVIPWLVLTLVDNATQSSNANTNTADASNKDSKDKTDRRSNHKEKGRSLSSSNKRPEGLLNKVIQKLGYDPLSTSPPTATQQQQQQQATSSLDRDGKHSDGSTVPKRPVQSCPENMDVPLDFGISPLTSPTAHNNTTEPSSTTTTELVPENEPLHEHSPSSSTSKPRYSKKSRSSSRDRDRDRRGVDRGTKDENLGSSGEKERDKEVVQFKQPPEREHSANRDSQKLDKDAVNRRSSSPLQGGSRRVSASNLRTSSPDSSPSRHSAKLVNNHLTDARAEKVDAEREDISGGENVDRETPPQSPSASSSGAARANGKPKPRHRSKTVDAASGAKLLSEGDQEKIKRRRSISKNVSSVLAGSVCPDE